MVDAEPGELRRGSPRVDAHGEQTPDRGQDRAVDVRPGYAGSEPNPREPDT